jgi:hypothetical protein
MGIFNAFIAYKFIKILSMPWEDTDAFKFGIIDKDGKVLKKMKDLRTSEEKKSYTIFHRLIWNLKKILEKLPIFKSRLASFAAALYLIKEQADPEGTLIEDMFLDFLKENGCDVDSMMLNESFEMRDANIKRGLYIIEGKNIFIEENIKAFDEILGIPLFKIDFLGEEKVITKEDAIANVAGGGENIAGLDGKPPVSKKPKIQRRAGITGGIADDKVKESVELDEIRISDIPADKKTKDWIQSGRAKILMSTDSTLGGGSQFVIVNNFRSGAGQDKVLMAIISDPDKGRIKMFSFHGTHVNVKGAMKFAKNNKLVTGWIHNVD